MARAEIERTAQPSVLDRLIDLTPRAGDAPTTLAQSVRQVKDAVRRDLEWLLNSRRTIEPAPAPLRELRRSLYHYGLPDLSSLTQELEGDRVRLLRSVEEAVALFEPRLTGVRISVVESQSEDEPHKRELRFLIEGTLLMEPTPERVAFDTVMDVASGECEVRGERGA